jgi:hypothetical protein
MFSYFMFLALYAFLGQVRLSVVALFFRIDILCVKLLMILFGSFYRRETLWSFRIKATIESMLRIWLRRIGMFLGFLDADPSIMQKK